MRAVVVHADDLGLSRAFNKGILAAVREGAVRSTCLRVNGLAYRHALDEILPVLPGIGLGVHLNLVEGVSGRKKSAGSLLCDQDGRYRLGFGGLWRGRRDPRLLADVEADCRDQIETILKAGLKVDHLNSHQHSHVIPELFALVCRLAAEYRIPFVRLPREKWHWASPVSHLVLPWIWSNQVKHFLCGALAERNRRAAEDAGVKTNRWFVGLLYTGHMSSSTVLAGLDALKEEEGPVEVLLHPAAGPEHEDFFDLSVKSYVNSPARAAELEAARAPQVAARLARWKPANYRELAA